MGRALESSRVVMRARRLAPRRHRGETRDALRSPSLMGPARSAVHAGVVIAAVLLACRSKETRQTSSAPQETQTELETRWDDRSKAIEAEIAQLGKGHR